MGGFLSFFQRKEPKTPIKSCIPRLANILKYNFRGIFGVLIAVGALSWQGEQYNFANTTKLIWILMFITALFRPVTIPVVGFIPVFILPMLGAFSSDLVCKCYFGENLVVFILGGMIMLLLNNSGVDRRMVMWFLNPKGHRDLTALGLVIKCAMPAYILSGISNRLLVTSYILQTLTPPLMSLQQSTKGRGNDADFDRLRTILFNAVHSSSGIGSLILLPGSVEVMTFKNGLDEDVRSRQKIIKTKAEVKGDRLYEYIEPFNFLQYTMFMFPVTIVMFLLNLLYHVILIKMSIKREISKSSSTYIKQTIAKYKNELPESITSHEYVTVLCFILIYTAYFLRNTGPKIGFHWAEESIPGYVQDAVVSAGAVFLLHILPKSLGFIRMCAANKKRDLPPAKPESGILFWRFVDKNTIYCYIFVIGAGGCLLAAIYATGLGKELGQGIGRDLVTNMDFTLFSLLAVTVPALLANMMPGAFGCLLALPFFINTARFNDAMKPHLHVIALAVGASSALGFCFPFKYTPAYFTYHVGKVPMLNMMYTGYWSTCICEIVLWASIAFGSEAIFGKFKEIDEAP